MRPAPEVQHSGIVVLAEAPAGAEEARGEPLIGPSGSLFNAALSRAGIRRDRLWIANTASCRFTGDSAASEESRKAIYCCLSGLRAELKDAWDVGYTTILALGQTALEALSLEGSISKARGSLYTLNAKTGLPPFKVVPSYHPAAIPRWTKGASCGQRGRADPILTLISDMEKAAGVASGKVEVAAERFTIRPSFYQVRDHLVRIADEKALVGCDIESDGLRRYTSEIVCIGLALSGEEALVVPERLKGRNDFYFTERERAMLAPYWKAALENGRFIFQNAAFDVPFLRLKGYGLPVQNVEHDTYLLHSVIAPEEEHNLGYITSIFGRTPYWKDSFKNRPGSIYDMNPEELWTYNARDSGVLHQVIDPMLEEADRLDVRSEYENVTMPLFRRSIMEMEEVGIGFDYERLGEFSSVLDGLVTAKETKLRELGGLPPNFELTNSAHLAWFLYGFKPKWAHEIQKEVAQREDDIHAIEEKLALLRSSMEESLAGTRMSPKARAKALAQAEAALIRKSNAKVYLDLKDKADLATKVVPLFVPAGWSPPTSEKTGIPSTDKAALLSLSLKLTAENAERDRRSDAHEKTLRELEDNLKADSKLYTQRKAQLEKAQEESIAIQKVLEFLEGLRDLKEYTKLKESFTSYKPAPDQRVHPWWNAGGAATGRLSCLDPNLMQLPKQKDDPDDPACEIRKFFIGRPRPDPTVLVSADYENAEVGLFGYELGDPIIIDAYLSGKNIHDLNTQTLFRITKDHPLWKSGRAAAKIVQLGCFQYGGSLRGIHRQIVLKAPNLKLTYAQLEEAANRWFAEHVEFEKWDRAITAQVLSERIIRNEFGRVRVFLAHEADIPRAAKNFRIQSACASLVNRATIAINEERDSCGLASKQVLQIHDQLVYESPVDEAPRMISIMKKHLEAPFMYKGIERNLRVGLEWGPTLGDLEEIEGEIPSEYNSGIYEVKIA